MQPLYSTLELFCLIKTAIQTQSFAVIGAELKSSLSWHADLLILLFSLQSLTFFLSPLIHSHLLNQPSAKGGSGKMLSLINYRLRVTLSDGRQITGQLLAFDAHMNVVLSECEYFFWNRTLMYKLLNQLAQLNRDRSERRRGKFLTSPSFLSFSTLLSSLPFPSNLSGRIPSSKTFKEIESCFQRRWWRRWGRGTRTRTEENFGIDHFERREHCLFECGSSSSSGEGKAKPGEWESSVEMLWIEAHRGRTKDRRAWGEWPKEEGF